MISRVSVLAASTVGLAGILFFMAVKVAWLPLFLKIFVVISLGVVTGLVVELKRAQREARRKQVWDAQMRDKQTGERDRAIAEARASGAFDRFGMARIQPETDRSANDRAALLRRAAFWRP